MSHSISRMPISLPNILAITGGSVEDKKKVKKNHDLEPGTKHSTISHDRLTTAMLSNARTVNFIPRICMQKISGEQWQTFYHFASYKEAHTTALQDIKTGNSLRKVDSDATHDFLLPPPPQPGVQGWRQKCTFICKHLSLIHI